MTTKTTKLALQLVSERTKRQAPPIPIVDGFPVLPEIMMYTDKAIATFKPFAYVLADGTRVNVQGASDAHAAARLELMVGQKLFFVHKGHIQAAR